MVPVKYVGIRAGGFIDNLYGSGATWARPGDVVEIDDYPALLLLRHPEFEDGRKGKLYGTPIKAKAPEKETDDDQRPPPVQLEAMTKAEIATYAKRSFGIDLNLRETKDELVHRVSRMVGMARV